MIFQRRLIQGHAVGFMRKLVADAGDLFQVAANVRADQPEEMGRVDLRLESPQGSTRRK